MELEQQCLLCHENGNTRSCASCGGQHHHYCWIEYVSSNQLVETNNSYCCVGCYNSAQNIASLDREEYAIAEEFAIYNEQGNDTASSHMFRMGCILHILDLAIMDTVSRAHALLESLGRKIGKIGKSPIFLHCVV